MYRIIDNIETISGSLLEHEISLLPPWRQEVVMRYKFESGRRESTLAFRLLQQMLAENYPAIDLSAIQFHTGEHGKPLLLSHPQVHFNLSHCSHAVACALADHPVGIDIECRGRYKHTLAAYCMSAEELVWIEEPLSSSNPDTQAADLRFTTLWTQKEALLKLLGTGITDDIKNVLTTHANQVTFQTTHTPDYVCTFAEVKKD